MFTVSERISEGSPFVQFQSGGGGGMVGRKGGERGPKETCFGQDLVLTPLTPTDRETASRTFSPRERSRQTTNKNVFPTAASFHSPKCGKE